MTNTFSGREQHFLISFLAFLISRLSTPVMQVWIAYLIVKAHLTKSSKNIVLVIVVELDDLRLMHIICIIAEINVYAHVGGE